VWWRGTCERALEWISGAVEERRTRRAWRVLLCTQQTTTTYLFRGYFKWARREPRRVMQAPKLTGWLVAPARPSRRLIGRSRRRFKFLSPAAEQSTWAATRAICSVSAPDWSDALAGTVCWRARFPATMAQHGLETKQF
jgi:hypothetical protein